jgi:hypothetical protein
MAETITANVMAARLSRELKRPITAKAVRGWVRQNMAAHDKAKHPEYQAHLYTAAEQAAITKGFRARSANARVQAEAKRPRAAAKAATKPRAAKPQAKPVTKPAAPEAPAS